MDGSCASGGRVLLCSGKSFVVIVLGRGNSTGFIKGRLTGRENGEWISWRYDY